MAPRAATGVGPTAGAPRPPPPLPRRALAQALGPELAEPEGSIAQPIRISHQHMDAGGATDVREVKGSGQPGGGILLLLRGFATPAHFTGPGQHLCDVDSHERGGKQTHSGEDRETARHVLRNGQRCNAFVVGNRFQGTPLGVGGEDEMPAVSVAEFRLQRRLDNQELGCRLGRGARLGDDVEQGSPQLDPAQKWTDRVRVDVVEHIEPRVVVALLFTQLVPPGPEQRRADRDSAQRRAAYSQHHDILEGLSGALRKLENVVYESTAVGQVIEAKHARTTLLPHTLVESRELPVRQLMEPATIQPLTIDEHVVQSERQRHSSLVKPGRSPRPARHRLARPHRADRP